MIVVNRFLFNDKPKKYSNPLTNAGDFTARNQMMPHKTYLKISRNKNTN